MRPLKLAVLGAGMIGKRHAELIAREPRASLSAVVDPSPVGSRVAEQLGARWFASFADLTAADRPDGVIIATPNPLHVQIGLEAVAAGVPAIVEKPLSILPRSSVASVARACGGWRPARPGQRRGGQSLHRAARGR
ncbi:MAG: Gfo/Idh/MocA family oxidoreductase [Roseiarcus sp.]